MKKLLKKIVNIHKIVHFVDQVLPIEKKNPLNHQWFALNSHS